MAFAIKACQYSDLPELVDVFLAAFENGFFKIMLPDVPLDKRREWILQLDTKIFDESAINGARYFKAVDNTSG